MYKGGFVKMETSSKALAGKLHRGSCLSVGTGGKMKDSRKRRRRLAAAALTAFFLSLTGAKVELSYEKTKLYSHFFIEFYSMNLVPNTCHPSVRPKFQFFDGEL